MRLSISAASLVVTGIQDGQDPMNAAPYVEAMYGEHLDWFREIKKRYDPEDVMDLHTDGNPVSDSRPCFR
jgi:hypothetical protein